MPPIILDQSPYWHFDLLEDWLPTDFKHASLEVKKNVGKLIVATFQQIARQNGSQAVWMIESGTLATSDTQEPGKNFLYYAWRRFAIEAVIMKWGTDTLIK